MKKQSKKTRHRKECRRIRKNLQMIERIKSDGYPDKWERITEAYIMPDFEVLLNKKGKINCLIPST